MHIIIDGYNLIRQSGQLRRFERLGLEEGRKHLIEKLANFKKVRGHKVTVVFDGWQNGPLAEERTREGSILVIYSKRGERADDVIRKMAAGGGKGLMVITSDRDLAFAVSRFGAIAISSQRFEDSMDQLAGSMGTEMDKDLDDEDISLRTKKKGPAKRISKNKRAALSAVKKL